jgi:hypothetical protein
MNFPCKIDIIAFIRIALPNVARKFRIKEREKRGSWDEDDLA